MSKPSSILYTKHLRYPGPAFLKNQAPSIATSANADVDTLTELALMGTHVSPPGGVQLLVQRKEMDDFMRYMPTIPFEDLAWPARTVELYLDYPQLPTILTGCFSTEDFERMGLKGIPNRETTTHLLIQESVDPVTIQAYYYPDDINVMVRTHPDRLGDEENGLSSRENTLMKLSATFVYRALELFNRGKFVKYSSLSKVPWRDGIRNRPLGMSLILDSNFNTPDSDAA